MHRTLRTQVIIFADVWNAPIKRGHRPTKEINRYGLHHGLTKFGRIRHNISRHRSPDENEPFYSMQEGPRRTTICNTIPEGNHTITWHTTLHLYRQRESVYMRIMEAHYGESQNRTKVKHGIPPTNGQTDRTNECDTRTVPTSLYQLPTR